MELLRNRKKAVNRRREPRYDLATLTAYTDEGADYKEKLVNVSRTGCCIISPVSLDKGEHILIHFIATNNYYIIDDSFCLDGCIVWRNKDTAGSYRYGVEFPKVRTEFLAAENRAFQDHVAQAAIRSYLKSAKKKS
jgi:hypothetical protein